MLKLKYTCVNDKIHQVKSNLQDQAFCKQQIVSKQLCPIDVTSRCELSELKNSLIAPTLTLSVDPFRLGQY